MLLEVVPLSTEVAPPRTEQLCIGSSLVPSSSAPAEFQEDGVCWDLIGLKAVVSWHGSRVGYETSSLSVLFFSCWCPELVQGTLSSF